MAFAGEQDLKYSWELQFWSFLYAFEFKEGIEGRLHEGGGKQGGAWITEYLRLFDPLRGLHFRRRGLKRGLVEGVLPRGHWTIAQACLGRHRPFTNIGLGCDYLSCPLWSGIYDQVTLWGYFPQNPPFPSFIHKVEPSWMGFIPVGEGTTRRPSWPGLWRVLPHRTWSVGSQPPEL